MSTEILINVAPRENRAALDAQIAEHAYGSSSEYLRDLIRKQREVEKLRAMLMEGANSGQGRPVDDAVFTEPRDIAKSRAAA